MSRSNKCLKICVQAFIVLAAVAAMAAADNAPRYGYAPAPAPYAPAPAPYAPAPAPYVPAPAPYVPAPAPYVPAPYKAAPVYQA